MTTRGDGAGTREQVADLEVVEGVVRELGDRTPLRPPCCGVKGRARVPPSHSAWACHLLRPDFVSLDTVQKVVFYRFNKRAPVAGRTHRRRDMQ